MKALRKILILGFLTLAVIGCKKESTFTIVGDWNIELITIDIMVNGAFKLPAQELADNGEVVFREDNTGNYARISDFTWTQTKSHLTIKFDGESELDFPDLEFDLTTMEAKKVVGETSFSLTLDDLDGIGDLIDLPDLPPGFDWDLIFGDVGLQLSLDLECTLGKY